MADLKVEKKKRFPVLWTILGIIAVGAIVWFIWDMSDDDVNDQQEIVESEQIRNENFYVEPQDWEGAETDPWDDEATANEDWRAERSDVWGDESDAVMDEDMAAKEMTSNNMNSNEETFGEEENVAGETRAAKENVNTFGMNNSETSETDVNAPDTTGQYKNFKNFLAFAQETDAEDINRRSTYRGIKKLTMAISKLEVTDSSMVNWQSDIDKLKYQTEQLRDDRMSGRQSSVIKSTFLDIAHTFEDIKDKTNIEIDEQVSQVMQAARKINQQDMASNQRAEIDNFFDEAADLLEELKENPQNSTTSSFN